MLHVPFHLSGVGIDVSDHHVRLARVSRWGRVRAVRELTLPEGCVEDEQVRDPKHLRTFLESALARGPFSRRAFPAVLLVPESRVFSSQVSLSAGVARGAWQEEARRRAQQDIPLSFTHARVSFESMADKSVGPRVTAYAAEEAVVEGLLAAVGLPSFAMAAAEANTKAVWRLCRRFAPHVRPAPRELLGIVDVGHTWATIAFYADGGSCLFSRTFRVHPPSTKRGTDALLSGIPSKRSVDMILETIQDSVVYFEPRGWRVSCVVLAGVEAAHKTVLEACAKVRPELPMFPIGKVVRVPGLSPREVHAYGAALGAALRAACPRRFSADHTFI
ncbi:pilus assembly protein PilM [Candidatus Uhrbacteria bacterium]|nr:pilus assembly protein PilM [Candidatus Uhrbacteria bacterium]